MDFKIKTKMLVYPDKYRADQADFATLNTNYLIKAGKKAPDGWGEGYMEYNDQGLFLVLPTGPIPLRDLLAEEVLNDPMVISGFTWSAKHDGIMHTWWWYNPADNTMTDGVQAFPQFNLLSDSARAPIYVTTVQEFREGYETWK